SRLQIPIVRQNRKPFGDQGIFVKIHGAKGPEFGTTRLPQVVPETQRTPTSLEFDPAAGLHQTLKRVTTVGGTGTQVWSHAIGEQSEACHARHCRAGL